MPVNLRLQYLTVTNCTAVCFEPQPLILNCGPPFFFLELISNLRRREQTSRTKYGQTFAATFIYVDSDHVD